MVDEVKEVAVARAPGCHLAARRRHSNACPRSRPCQSHRLRASLRIASCSTSLRGHKNRKRLAWNHTQASNPHPDEPRASSKYRTTTARKEATKRRSACAAFQSSFLRTSFRSWLQLWTRITDTAHDTGSTKLKAHAPKPTFARTVVVNYNWVQTAFASDHNQHTRRRSLRSRVTHVAMAFPQESASRRSLLDV